jgi:hypothetical protein
MSQEDGSDRESFDSQATVVIEDDAFNPIRLINCATLIEPTRDIVRRMGIFEYEGKGITAFYQSSGTSGSPLLRGTYVPFYGETKKLLKAIDINMNTQSKAWKIALRPHCNFSHKILNYFEEFYELQISASIDSIFWDETHYRDFVLSREWNEITRDFDLLPERIPHSGHFSEMDCARRIEMETGQINEFLRSNKVKISLKLGELPVKELQQKEEQEGQRRLEEMYALQQQQLEEEDKKEKIGRLKTDAGGKGIKTKKQKKYNKQNKSKKQKKTIKRKNFKKSKKYK